MLVIVGLVVVFGAVMAGFTWAGGKVPALIQPSELTTIGGAAIGALIIMSPKSVLVGIGRGIIQCVKGSPYTKAAYEEMFKLLYDLSRLARREGLIALEQHVSIPDDSPVFRKYPRMKENHHVREFICGALALAIEGTAKPEQMPGLLEAEIKVIEEEHHGPLGVLQKTADALPGFGIVAAVLGIVVTMAAIDGPPEEIGEKVGAALVGTFLGILLSYGFFAPLSVRLEFIGAAELAFFRTISVIIQGFVNGTAPKVTMEQARRGLAAEVRPTRDEMDQLFAEVEAS